jgi:hypothetical protein
LFSGSPSCSFDPRLLPDEKAALNWQPLVFARRLGSRKHHRQCLSADSIDFAEPPLKSVILAALQATHDVMVTADIA